MAAYTFRVVERADLPMLRAWLETPAVRDWWRAPDDEIAGMAEDIEDPRMAQRIVSFEDRPFAYVQAYEAHAWPQPHLAGLEHGTQVIDTFIGVPDMLGGGHGGGYLRAYAEQLLAEGAPGVAIDPDNANHRARRAYARAGFVEVGEVDTGSGPAVLMVFGR
jgi:aminoglycoside 6'-N-acetyltransferase